MFIFSVSLCFSLAFFGLPPLFLFVVFAFLFQDVLLFLFFCLLSCVVLNHNNSFIFSLHLVFLLLLLFFVFVAFIFCYSLNFGNLSKTSLKNTEIRKTAKIKNAEKTDILTRTVSTAVFANSVFFCFCVSFNFAFC